ncbi:aldose 1-epimerase [Diaporthe eres]|uniref:Glucose-6-phosphate 1-epimerase n=1 Tax=Diaporthe vaccinii TaxID=105482 RepID=A0ABR4DRP0_9PEZI|nr:aldose 1-epimerase [Diaporthe eres]
MMLPSLLPLGTACLFLAQAQAGPLSHRASPPSVIEGEGTVEATLPSGDAVTVYLHGATVTSWKSSDGDEKIFLSTASALDGSAAIRGGIPVVFPNFGSPPDEGQTSELPSHGFARNSTWTFDSSTPQEDGSGVALKFLLDSASLSADYQARWPYSAKLAYTVNLTQDNLNVHFSFENTDTQAIDFQFLLHTYLTVPNINTTTVSGLQGSTYQDKTQNYTVVTETSDALRITGETDRIYSPASVAPIVLNDNGNPRVTVDRSETLPDTTVWNTWATKILSTKDFAPKDAWQHYLAIEPGYVAKFNSLEPGSTWEAGVSYVAHV